MKNSFNKMEEENIRSFDNSPSARRVHSKVSGTIGTMRFLGQVADVYVGRLADMMASMASSKVNTNNEKHRADDTNNPNEHLKKSKYPNL